jgi:hypothetical protein
MGRVIVSLAFASYLCILPCHNLLGQSGALPDVQPAGGQPGNQGSPGGQSPAPDQTAPAGAVNAPQDTSLTREEIDAVITSPDFNFKVQVCVGNKQHPDQIWLNLEIREDGSAQLLSIEPAPLADVFLCLTGAVSTLKFRASGKSGTVKYLYSLAGLLSLEPQPLWGSEKPKKEKPRFPGGRRGGFGIYGALIPFDRGLNSSSHDDIDWYGQFTGGIGLFGELLVAPVFALGLELFVAFPKVEQVKIGGGDKEDCSDCEQDFIVNFVARSKFVIRAAKKISLYPLVLFGYSDYISRAENRKDYNFHGIAFGLGAGIEGYAGSAVTPFFELRYLLNAGWHEEESVNVKMALVHHELALNFGLRFP